MREPRSKLLHLAHRIRQFLLDQHLEVGANHLVAIGLAGFFVRRCGIEFPRSARDLGVRLRRRTIASTLLRWTAEDGCPYVVFAEPCVVLLDLAEDPGIRGRRPP